MTWVVGIPGMMSGATMMADVRISRPDGSPITGFGVQKLHPICPMVMAGFAGSVTLGFRVIEALQAQVPERDDGIYSPASVTLCCRRIARRVWHSAPPEQRAGSLALMLIGAGLRPRGFPPGFPIARTYGYVLRSPRFDLERMPLRRHGSIGSGSDVPRWIEMLDEEFILGDEHRLTINEKTFNTIRNETVFPLGTAPVLFSFVLTSAMEEHPLDSVGKELHLGWVSHQGLWITTNEMEPFDGEAGRRIRMPPLAATYADFVRLARRGGLAGLTAYG